VQYLDTKKKRPLSPHISIYKPQITSALSITHRITGVVNYVGIICIIWWLVDVAFSATYPQDRMIWSFFGSTLGNIVLIAWSFSVYMHFCTGMRHLFWDMGKGFDIETVTKTGIIAVISAIILTAFTWLIIYGYLG